MAQRHTDRGSLPPLTADELEQRQRADGSYETDLEAEAPSEAAAPDVIEQRQRADGRVESSDVVGDLPDHPLSPDEIEQRLVVEDDEDERPRE